MGLTFLLGAFLVGPTLNAAVLAGGCLASVVVVGTVAHLRKGSARWFAVFIVLANAAGGTYLTMRTGIAIDVVVFLRDASRALIEGRNPYTLTFPNVYSAEDAARLYGPGVVVGDRVTYGFPYLPATLLWPLTVVTFGDVRLAGVGAVAVLSISMLVAKPTWQARAIALAIACAPATWLVVVGGWTETTLVATLGLAVVAAQRHRLIMAAVLLGLLLVSKQYFVVTLPCLYLLRDYANRARVFAMTGAATAVTIPFAVVNFGAFRKAVVDYQFIQPLRSDSVSLLVWSVDQFEWPSATMYALLPLTCGFLTALLLAWKSPPGIEAFCAATAVSLLAVILLSKQAFLNYYYFVGGALLIAAWAANRPATPTPLDRRAGPLG